jgi:uncharacterized RDD family membrane protein YckC
MLEQLRNALPAELKASRVNLAPSQLDELLIIQSDDGGYTKPACVADAPSERLDLPNIRPIAPGLRLTSFGARTKAWLLDALLLAFLVSSICLLLFAVEQPMALDPSQVGTAMLVLGIVVPWIYCAGLEAAPTQGTVGKLYFDGRVSTIDGGRISFVRASIRFAFKSVTVVLVPVAIVSALVAFKFERGQSLHDLVARTIVIRRGPRPR